MSPAAGLNVITGETGAGKSIMLGALGLLMGNRADTKVLWDENEKCVTEAEFDISAYRLQPLFKNEDLDYADQTVIRREINAGGKSRAFINDTPVTLDVLKKISSRLMDIHSQHETLELGTRSFQLRLIDAFAGNQKIREDYGVTWKEFLQAREKHEALVREASFLEQEGEFIRFQLNELSRADLKDDEQEKLETELKLQEHAEEIRMRLAAASESMGRSDYSLKSVMANIRVQLNAITSYSPAYEKLASRMEVLKIEMDELFRELEQEESQVEFDPQRMEWVNDRLSTIYQLMQKHRVQTVSELLTLQQDFHEKADKAGNLDTYLAESKKNLELLETSVNAKALALSKTRQKVFTALTKQIVELLTELGIRDGQIKIDRQEIAPGATGTDLIDVLFSANKGMAPRPLAQVASGGEFARLMFCVKYVMAEKTAMPTLILDEIDTGVSGETAIRLGNLMKEMAERHQIMAITHLPQIAAKGEAHYFVYKDTTAKKTISQIKRIEGPERIEQIATMIGGAQPSRSAIENARELISR